MDPLIELPELARARIKARESEADEQADLVRRDLDTDLESAVTDWGGYSDLHQKKLSEAIGETRDGVRTAALLSAQYVFLAHAREYRSALHDPAAAEPILARLREAVIERYGEHTRASIECREAQQMEEAWAEHKTAPEVARESIAPILVGDAQFWRERRTDFRAFDVGENTSLCADLDSLTDTWTFRGSQEALLVFKSLATIAAQGFQTYDREEPWRSWLDELRRGRRNYQETPTAVTYSKRAMEDPTKFGIEPPVVQGVVRTSIVAQNEVPTELPAVAPPVHKQDPFTQVRFEGVRGHLKRLFEASTNLCLEFESRTRNGPTPTDESRQEVDPTPNEQGISGTESHSALAATRQAIVMPILNQKKWSRSKWAAKAGVGKNSVYEYLEGERNLTDKNRQALAEELGLKAEDLPN